MQRELSAYDNSLIVDVQDGKRTTEFYISPSDIWYRVDRMEDALNNQKICTRIPCQ